MTSTNAAPAVRVLRPLLAIAVLVSIVHYTDNTFNYEAYPRPSSGPAPSQALVAASWFAFTAFGVAGYVLLRRGRSTIAAICLAVYAGSGLVGLGHYTVAGATSMAWWRQAHIVADIACGVAILAFAVWLVRRAPRRGASDDLERRSSRSDPLLDRSAVAVRVAGVRCADRLDQQHVCFGVGHRAVLDPARDHEQLL